MARPKKQIDAVRLLKMREAGLTIREIAKAFKVSPATAFRVLKQIETRTNAVAPGGFETNPEVMKQPPDVVVIHGDQKPPPPVRPFEANYHRSEAATISRIPFAIPANNRLTAPLRPTGTITLTYAPGSKATAG